MRPSAQDNDAWARGQRGSSFDKGFRLLVDYGLVALVARYGRIGARSLQDRPAIENKGPGATATPAAAAKRASSVLLVDIAKAVTFNFSAHRIMALAAEITFYSLLAVFPGIAALVSLYGLFANPNAISGHLNAMKDVLPAGAISLIGDQVASLAKAPGNSLSLGFGISLVVALWSANSGMKSVFDAFNVVFERREGRGFFRLTLVTLSLTFGVILLVIFALGSMIVVPILTAFVSGALWTESLSLARWPAMLVFVYAVLSILYRVGPSEPSSRGGSCASGAIFASVAWLGASMLFSWYVGNFGSYNKTYGSLGAVAGFMTWMWISAMIVLVGAEINAELDRRRLRRLDPAPRLATKREP